MTRRTRLIRLLAIVAVGAVIVEIIKNYFGIRITSDQLSPEIGQIICMVLYMVWGGILVDAERG